METAAPLLKESKIGKEFMDKLFEIFPDAQVSSAFISNKDDVFEARVSGVQLSHEDLERVLTKKPLRFRIENGNLIASLDVHDIRDDALQRYLWICVWLVALCFTILFVYLNLGKFTLIFG